MKVVEQKSVEEIKAIVQQAVNEAADKVVKDVDSRLAEVQNKLSKIDTVAEKLESIEGKLAEINNKLDQINGKTGGVKGLMFFLWLLLMGTVIFDILLNIPATQKVILQAIGGGSAG